MAASAAGADFYEIVFRTSGSDKMLQTMRYLKQAYGMVDKEANNMMKTINMLDKLYGGFGKSAKDATGTASAGNRTLKKTTEDSERAIIRLARAQAGAESAAGKHSQAIKTLTQAYNGLSDKKTVSAFGLEKTMLNAKNRGGMTNNRVVQESLYYLGQAGRGAYDSGMGTLNSYADQTRLEATIKGNLGRDKMSYYNEIKRAAEQANLMGFDIKDVLGAAGDITSIGAYSGKDMAPLLQLSAKLARAGDGSVSEGAGFLTSLKSVYGLDSGQVSGMGDKVAQMFTEGKIKIPQAYQFLPGTFSTMKNFGLNAEQSMATIAAVSPNAPMDQVANRMQNFFSKAFDPSAQDEKWQKEKGISGLFGIKGKEFAQKDFEGWLNSLVGARKKFGSEFDQKAFSDMQAKQGVMMLTDAASEILRIVKNSGKGSLDEQVGIRNQSFGYQQDIANQYADRFNRALGQALGDSDLPINDMKKSAYDFMTKLVEEHKNAASGIMMGLTAGGFILDRGSQLAIIAMGVKQLAPGIAATISGAVSGAISSALAFLGGGALATGAVTAGAATAVVGAAAVYSTDSDRRTNFFLSRDFGWEKELKKMEKEKSMQEKQKNDKPQIVVNVNGAVGAGISKEEVKSHMNEIVTDSLKKAGVK